MNVRDALLARKSTRAFLRREIEAGAVERILESARHAPSGANTQPWQVAVVSGAKKREVQEALEAAFYRGEPKSMDYRYYPLQWFGPYKKRRVECGLQLYSSLGIDRQDKARRREQWAANYRAFDAPLVLYFFLDPRVETGSFMDCGMFLQSVMLAAVEEGLASCPQAALAEYPQIVKKALGYPETAILVCGMALGYEDPDAPVNGYRTSRLDVSEFTKFFTDNP